MVNGYVTPPTSCIRPTACPIQKRQRGEERSERIVQSAMLLADQAAFTVRLRDVAAHPGVAPGTLYSRFKSKEDILVAALDAEMQKFETLLQEYPLSGKTPKRVSRTSSPRRALFARLNLLERCSAR